MRVRNDIEMGGITLVWDNNFLGWRIPGRDDVERDIDLSTSFQTSGFMASKDKFLRSRILWALARRSIINFAV